MSTINENLKTKWKEKRWNFIIGDIKDTSKYPLGSKEFLKKRFETLKSLFHLNEFFKFLTYKLQKFHESRLLAIFSILKLVFTFFLTVIAFGLIYYAIAFGFPDDFNPTLKRSIFEYLYFSFNKLLMMDVSNLSAVGVISRIATVLQIIFAISLTAILFFIFTTIIKEKSEKELKDLIKLLELESVILNEMLKDDFDTTFAEVESEMAEKEPKSLELTVLMRRRE